MYKLLFLDMDGTLLSNNKTISSENKLAIKAAQDKGVKIVLCTGRPLEGITSYLNQLDLMNISDYSITSSGGMIMNNACGNIISRCFFNAEALKYLCSMAQFLNLDLSFYSNGKISVYRHNLYSYLDSVVNSSIYEVQKLEDIFKNTEISKVNLINEHKGALKDYAKLFGLDTSSYNSFAFRENPNVNIFSDISNLPFYLLENFSVLKLSNCSYEVLNKGTNKGTSVKTLSNHLNISLNEVICIGDSGNDEHMIHCAGLGVAMGNAQDKIKAVANYVTLSNEENGVAHVIEKFIL